MRICVTCNKTKPYTAFYYGRRKCTLCCNKMKKPSSKTVEEHMAEESERFLATLPTFSGE